MRNLDPRAPLVLDTRELGRRPGSQRLMRLAAEAPAELGIEILGVPEGSEVIFDLRLEAVMEGVLVSGTASADLEGECARCLDPIEEDLMIDIQELFLYDDTRAGSTVSEDDSEVDEETDVRRTEGDLIDLEPVLRDAVVLALPFQPLCQDDCPGLCVDCGARLADDPEHRHDEPIDPRWAALQSVGQHVEDAAETDQNQQDPDQH